MWILRSTTLDKEQLVRLPTGTARTIGRGPRADFVIEATLLSRVHCQLSTTTNQLVVEDLKRRQLMLFTIMHLCLGVLN